MPSELRLTIQEEKNKQQLVLLSASAPYRFGRSSNCNYILRRSSVGPLQFSLQFKDNAWLVQDENAKKDTFLNGEVLPTGQPATLHAGDVIGLRGRDKTRMDMTCTVDIIQEVVPTKVPGRGTVIKMNASEQQSSLHEIDLRQKKRVLIGRGEDCTIVVDNDRVSKHHCEIVFKDGTLIVNDLHSTNGTYVNGMPIRHTVLGDRATINVPTQVFAIDGGVLRYHARTLGISVELLNVVKTVSDRNTHKPLNITDNISMLVQPNTFVALIGGSGAGKSSLLTCINGLAPCTGGRVCFDRLDTRNNRHAFDSAVGNVPQRDILHESLTVTQSLMFMARLRIAGDATRDDLRAAVAKAIADVELTGKEHTMIANLSGGQKKRVSIAMELLARPRLLLLDEPTSGLSPDLDRSLMELLRKLSRNNCTIICVTHNMDNINLCDKIAFLGRGGKLCYYGAPEYMKPYFGVETTSDVFQKVGDPDQSALYSEQYWTSPEFNKVLDRYPEVLAEVEV